MAVFRTTHLRVSLPLNGAMTEVRESLRSYFQRMCGAEDATTTTRYVPFPALGGLEPTVLPHDVPVRFAYTTNALDGSDCYSVAWPLSEAGTSPLFSGTVMSWEGDALTSIIGIEGSFASPLDTGASPWQRGSLYGTARETALALLRDIRFFVEGTPTSGSSQRSALVGVDESMIDEDIHHMAPPDVRVMDPPGGNITVVVTGEVNTWAERQAVERAAKAVQGIGDVMNLLRVR